MQRFIALAILALAGSAHAAVPCSGVENLVQARILAETNGVKVATQVEFKSAAVVSKGAEAVCSLTKDGKELAVFEWGSKAGRPMIYSWKWN